MAKQSRTTTINSLDATFVVTAYGSHEHASKQARVRLYVEDSKRSLSGTMTPKAARELGQALIDAAAIAEEKL